MALIRDSLLINLGHNPTPIVPEYYFSVFERVVHICPAAVENSVVSISQNEIVVRASACPFDVGFHLQRLGMHAGKIFVELAVQSGISYPGFSAPSNAVLMGRVCDLHHLSDPLTSLLADIAQYSFSCLIFSSCPHYIPLFSSILPCFFLPSDVPLSVWSVQPLHEWIQRPTPFKLDGSLISRFHPRRSVLFNQMLTTGSNKCIIAGNLSRGSWLSALGQSQVVIQHGLNGNAHPPFFSALSRGALPLIDSSSGYTLKAALGNSTQLLTYSTVDDLCQLLDEDPHALWRKSNVYDLIHYTRSVLLSTFSSWRDFLADKPYSPRSLGHKRLYLLRTTLHVLQAVQEVIRRCGYSVNYRPIELAFPAYGAALNAGYPSHLMELISQWPRELVRVWSACDLVLKDSPEALGANPNQSSMTLSGFLPHTESRLYDYPSAVCFPVTIIPEMSIITILN